MFSVCPDFSGLIPFNVRLYFSSRFQISREVGAAKDRDHVKIIHIVLAIA
jgi:hypothetical protein